MVEPVTITILCIWGVAVGIAATVAITGALKINTSKTKTKNKLTLSG